MSEQMTYRDFKHQLEASLDKAIVKGNFTYSSVPIMVEFPDGEILNIGEIAYDATTGAVLIQVDY